MKIACIVDPTTPPYRAGLVRQMARLLREWGARVTIAPAPAGTVVDPPEHRLYVIAAEGDAAHAVAADVDAHGGTVLNRYAALAALRQPALVARRLAAAGVPFALEPRPRPGPGPGAASPSAAITLDGIGGHVFGVKRGGPGLRDEPFTLGPEQYRLAMRCAHALELDLFAIDVALLDGAPVVVSVRPFPALRGVPDGALRLADFVYAAAERTRLAAPVATPHAAAVITSQT
jgi:hypothetical protein